MNSFFVWTAGDAVSAAAALFIILGWMCLSIKHWWKYRGCKHDEGVNETQACDAICRRCGKNLGFIGSWRKPFL